jgi:hypothetical protein
VAMSRSGRRSRCAISAPPTSTNGSRTRRPSGKSAFPMRCATASTRCGPVYAQPAPERCPAGKTHRKVLRPGFLHQQPDAHPQVTAPMPSKNRPITANSRYTDAVPSRTRLMPGRVAPRHPASSLLNNVLIAKGQGGGRVFLTDRRARVELPPGDLDPVSGRARLSYRRAAEGFGQATEKLPGGPRELHQLRHSALTHAAEDGANTSTLLAHSGHTSIASPARYARVSPAALGRWQESRDPAARGRWTGSARRLRWGGVVGGGAGGEGAAAVVPAPGVAAFLDRYGGDEKDDDRGRPMTSRTRSSGPGPRAGHRTGRCTAGSAWSRRPR